jgi:hypothetical protein
LSHRSALLLHGLPVIGAPPARPQLTVPPRASGDLLGAELHRATLADDDVAVVGDFPVTAIARSLIDVARRHSLLHSVTALDAALHTHRVTAEELAAVLLRWWNWPRIRQAQRAVELADALSESPLESVSRLVLRWEGLAPPALQVTLLDPYGAPVGRGDFYWDEFGVIAEADGRSKYGDRSALMKEKLRQGSRTWGPSSAGGAGRTRCTTGPLCATGWSGPSSEVARGTDRVCPACGRSRPENRAAAGQTRSRTG